jgi:hypothetical protein
MAYTGVTDSSGKFRVENVEPDQYAATATADGYTTRWTTARTQKAFTVAEQQEVTGIAIEVVPYGVIAGRVIDDAGQPLAGMRVVALSKSDDRLTADASATTDDRGRYRMLDVEPDKYYVMTTDAARDEPPKAEANVHRMIREGGYGAAFYPGVRDWKQGEMQRVRPGSEIAADFRMRKEASYHVRGRVSGALHGPAVVTAAPCDVSVVGFVDRMTQVRTDGTFDIGGLLAGEYCPTTQDGGLSLQGAPVNVKGEDVNGVEFRIPPRFTIRGSVTVEGAPLAQAPATKIFLLAPGNRGAVESNTGNDGILELPDVAPGAYRLVGLPRAGAYVKSIWYGTQDVSDGLIPMAQEGVPLRLILGSDPGQIAATAATASGASGAPLRWVLMPQGALAERRYLRQMTGPTGIACRFQGLTPGDYKLFAIEAADGDDIADPDLMKLLDANAVVVTVHAGGHESVTVTAISAGELERAKEKLP